MAKTKVAAVAKAKPKAKAAVKIEDPVPVQKINIGAMSPKERRAYEASKK